jgi:hypothetical protein
MAVRFSIRNYVRNGANITFDLVALNADGSVDTSFTGTVEFGKVGSAFPGIPAAYTFRAGDGGVRSFSATAVEANAQLIVSDPAGAIAESEILLADNANNNASGGAGGEVFDLRGGTNTQSGNGGEDTFYITAGANTVDGGADSDTLVIDTRVIGGGFTFNPPTQNADGLSGSFSWNGASVSYQRIEHFFVYSNAGNTIDNATFAGGNDTFVHYGLNSTTYFLDTVEFGAGTDTLVADMSAVTSFAVTFFAAPEPGRYILLVGGNGKVDARNVERFDIIGGAQNDTLIGLGLDDRLIGGAGADRLEGGAGNDTYGIDNFGDQIVDTGGIDTVIVASGAYNLAADIENVVLGAGGARVTGTDGANRFTGGSGSDIIFGSASQGSGPNLLVNGSFEQRDATTSSIAYVSAAPSTDYNGGDPMYRLTSQLLGWSFLPGTSQIEFNADNPNNPAVIPIADGQVILDMETSPGAQVGIFQDVAGLAAGARYRIGFSAALGIGPGQTAQINVLWNGAVVATLTPTSTAFTTYTVDVIAAAVGVGTGGANRLAFQEVGANDGQGRGTALDNVSLVAIVESADGDDLFFLNAGGEDSAYGGAGDDGFYFGQALDVNDRVDGGGGGNDQLALQGNYNLTLSGANIMNVETLALLSGADARFDDNSGNFYDYSLTLTGGWSGVTTFNGNGLRVGEDMTIDASATTSGRFNFFGGGGVDSLIGGGQNDGFFFAAGSFDPLDFVNGDGGADNQLALRGSFSGGAAATFGTGQLTNIQTIALISSRDARYGDPSEPLYSYTLTFRNGATPGTDELTVNGGGLLSGEVLIANGAQEATNAFRFIGGASADQLIGGAGDDIFFGGLGADQMVGNLGVDRFVYSDTAQSTTLATDVIGQFRSDDLIDLAAIDADLNTSGKQDFRWIGGNAFSGSAGELRVVSRGGQDYDVLADTDGDGSADFAILITGAANGAPTEANFIGLVP